MRENYLHKKFVGFRFHPRMNKQLEMVAQKLQTSKTRVLEQSFQNYVRELERLGEI